MTCKLNTIRRLYYFIEKNYLVMSLSVKISSLYSVPCMFSREIKNLEMFLETAEAALSMHNVGIILH